MKLPSPVTIQMPPITIQPGQVRTFDPITYTDLPLVTIDVSHMKRCEARLGLCPRSLVLWEGEAYDAAGDYTQAQVEARVLELLGPDIKAGLGALFMPPVRPAA